MKSLSVKQQIALVKVSGVASYVLLVGSLVVPYPAAAYIDPGIGSAFFQVLLAVFLGAGVGFRSVVHWFKNRKNENVSKLNPPEQNLPESKTSDGDYEQRS